MRSLPELTATRCHEAWPTSPGIVTETSGGSHLPGLVLTNIFNIQTYTKCPFSLAFCLPLV